MSRRWRVLAPVAASAATAATATLMSGCQGEQGSPPDTVSTERTLEPVLLVDDYPKEVFQTTLSGRVTLSVGGCFALDDTVIVAPPGSEVVDGGDAAQLADGPELHLGQQRTLQGSLVDPFLPESWKACVGPGEDPLFFYVGP